MQLGPPGRCDRSVRSVEGGGRDAVQGEGVAGLAAVVLGVQEAAAHRDGTDEPRAGAAVGVDEPDPYAAYQI